MDAIGGIIGVLIGFAIVVLIFIVLRELFCWYWKINKLVRIQQEILRTLLKTYEQNGGKVNWDAVKSITDN